MHRTYFRIFCGSILFYYYIPFLKDNLSKGETSTLKEIINDKGISIYPFDKGSGFVRIQKDYALGEVCDQIGKTKILANDPTH